MTLNFLEVLNIITSLLFMMLLSRKNDNATLLLVLFLSGSFYFSYAAIPLFLDCNKQTLTELHSNGSGALAKISTFIVICIVLSTLTKRVFEKYSFIELKKNTTVIIATIVLSMVLTGFALNYKENDTLQIHNILSILIMLFFIATSTLVIKKTGLNGININLIAKIGLVILLAIVIIGLYELDSLKAWATFQDSFAQTVYRASSILFNPNLLGYWASISYIFYAYTHACTDQTKTKSKPLYYIGMILSAFAIYLSGSRSNGYLLLLLMVLSAVLSKEKRLYSTVLILPITIFSAYLLLPLINSGEQFSILGQRFFDTPHYLIKYIFDYGSVPQEIHLSINGRLGGALSDNGWFVLYKEAGILGLSAVGFVCGLAIYKSTQAYRQSLEPSSAFILALAFYNVGNGFLMRIQIFPVWLFMGLTCIICIVHHSYVTIKLKRV